MQAYKSSPLSADITKIVKANYDPPPVKPYQYTRVSNRTKHNLIEERPKDLWQRHYQRRSDNLKRGFQSVQWESYKPIGGNVVLDPYDLVFSSLHNNLNPKVWKHPRAFKFNFEEKKDKRKMSILPPLLTSITDQADTEESLSETSVREDICPTAGFDKIRQYLNKSDQIIKNVRAGQSYEDYIRKLQESEKDYVDEKTSENEMVLMSLSDLGVGLPPLMSYDQTESPEDVEHVMAPACSKPSTPIFTFDLEKDSSIILPRKATNLNIPMLQMPVPSLAPGLGTGMEQKSKHSLDQVQLDNMTLNMPGLIPAASFIGRSKIDLCCSTDELERLQSESISPNLYVPSTTDTLINKKKRIRRDYLQFLEALNVVLTSIHNMKSKDLKSKVPLSADYLKVLQKEYISVPVTGENMEGKFTNVSRYQSRQLNRTSTTAVDSEAPTPFHPGLLTRRGTVVMDPSMAVLGLQRFSARSKKIKATEKNTKQSSQLQLDTWEDLLAVENKSSFNEKWLRDGVGIVVKALAWHRRVQGLISTSPLLSGSPQPEPRDQQIQSSIPQAQSSLTENRQASLRKLPLWQLIAMEKPTDVYKEKKKRRHSPDPTRVVERTRTKFHKLKCSIEQETQSELEKIEREKMANFKCKYSAFMDLSPLYAEHRFRLNLESKNIKLTLDPQDIHPSQWYEELCNKTYESITSPDDEEFNEVLQKISKFSLMDGKSLSYGKAKVCLLVMSLPLSEMWTFSYQKAVKYVLVTIMGCDVNDFIDWLTIRKMTFIIDK